MSDTPINRRALLAAGGLAASGLATSALATSARAMPALAQAPACPLAPAALPFVAQPLPFAPASLGWLSERLITSHHDNNYAGAVKRLVVIRDQFAALDPATAAGFALNGLKREELVAWNSMILHELYFAGLSGSAVAPSAALARAIERDFGSRDRWQAEFSGMGKALGGGSGWVVLTWSHRDQRLVNQWAADHAMAMVGATPLFALDMYEHAYALDFGARAGAYVDGFIQHASFAKASAIFARIG